MFFQNERTSHYLLKYDIVTQYNVSVIKHV